MNLSALNNDLINKHLGGIIRHLLGKPASLRAHLAKSATGVFALQVAATGVGLGTNVILARVLGTRGYGVYAYVLSVITFLSIPAIFGLPQLLVRNIAAYQTKKNWGLMRGLLRFADRTVLVVSSGLAALLGLGVWLFSDRMIPQMTATFLSALPLLALTAFFRIRGASLQGLNRIIQGQTVGFFVRLIFIFFIAGGYFLLRGINPPLAMEMQVLSVGIALLVSMLLLQKHLPKPVREVPSTFESRAWMGSAIPLLGIEVFNVGNRQVPILMLGPLAGVEAAGIYKIAVQTASLVTFAFVAVTIAIAPTISSLYTNGERERLQQIITDATRAVSLPAFILTVTFIIAGRRILPLLFGIEFAKGATALSILSVGSLIGVTMGPLGTILNMTGHERDTAWGAGVSTAINVILCTIFIPIWEIKGAAIAVAVSLVVRYLILVSKVAKKVNINPTVLGRSL